ncbi:MAG TPA: hypothetical protein VLX30_02740 [Burkholderiales bacterium]|nr:hypothetical protein [Burkholderiales bacterium]
MITRIPALLLALAATFGNGAQASPLDELGGTPVSKLEFGCFKLEVALTGIKDWPSPIAGANVSYRRDPDQIEILVALRDVRPDAFRTACAKTVGRVREFLYVDADGVAPMGRSFLGSYFRGLWKGPQRDAALRELDADTLIRVDVVGRGSCQAALTRAPITFEALSPRQSQ